MLKKKLWVILVTTVVLALAGSACAPKPGSQEAGRQRAEEFVKMEATYRFDGMPETFNLTSTTSVANGWKYTIEFDSRHPGYGNRTGQVLPQVITHHIAVVTVQNGEVTSAIMDGKYDMVKGREIQS